jgi:hypothetical protein
MLKKRETDEYVLLVGFSLVAVDIAMIVEEIRNEHVGTIISLTINSLEKTLFSLLGTGIILQNFKPSKANVIALHNRLLRPRPSIQFNQSITKQQQQC